MSSAYFSFSEIDGRVDLDCAAARYPVHSASTGTISGVRACGGGSAAELMRLTAASRASRTPVSGGCGVAYLLTHIRPLIPGSRSVSRCVWDMLSGRDGAISERRTDTTMAVQRSRYFAGAERRRTWSRHTRNTRGILGSRTPARRSVSLSMLRSAESRAESGGGCACAADSLSVIQPLA